jgi:hypothetical protein
MCDAIIVTGSSRQPQQPYETDRRHCLSIVRCSSIAARPLAVDAGMFCLPQHRSCYVNNRPAKNRGLHGVCTPLRRTRPVFDDRTGAAIGRGNENPRPLRPIGPALVEALSRMGTSWVARNIAAKCPYRYTSPKPVTAVICSTPRREEWRVVRPEATKHCCSSLSV